MGFIIILASLLAALYLLLLLYYVFHWVKIPVLTVPGSYAPYKGISVIVIARNEELSIETCLRSILNQQYPVQLFEVIVVDDRSTDKTSEIVRQIQSPHIQLLHLLDYPEFVHPPAYKKSGIELAVYKSSHNLIVMTDADCIHHPGWLRTVAYAEEKSGAVFIAGPIWLFDGKNILAKMQQMENQTFMVITAAGIQSGLHDIANGANMAFSKKAFLESGGYEGNYQYASGDDMFLVEKMRKYFPGKIAFVKSKTAIVYSSFKEDWKSLLRQRIRWSGKNKGLKSPVIRLVWTFIGFYHVMMIIMLMLSLYHIIFLWSFFILIFTKWMADYMVIQQASTVSSKPVQSKSFIPLQFIYTVYVLRLGWNLMWGAKGDW